MKIAINPGHTLTGPGSGAVGVLNEGQEARVVGRRVMELLRAQGHIVIDCTVDYATTTQESLAAAVDPANEVADLDLFVAIHFNAAARDTGDGKVKGTEVYVYADTQMPVANAVCRGMAALGFTDRGVKARPSLYVLRHTSAPAMLIEACFVDDADDAALYRKVGADAVAQAITSAITGTEPQAAGTAIMGSSEATAGQLRAYLLANNQQATAYTGMPEIYLEEGAAEGVRGDVAFCQALLETGFFRFGGDVRPEQNNYAGIGAIGSGAAGASFPDARTGVRAQIQHLQAYASTAALRGTCVDPRYKYVTRGVAPTVEDLGGRWAVPGYNPKHYASLQAARAAQDSYGDHILTHLRGAMSTESVPQDGTLWATISGLCYTQAEALEFQTKLAAAGINTVVHQIKIIQ